MNLKSRVVRLETQEAGHGHPPAVIIHGPMADTWLLNGKTYASEAEAVAAQAKLPGEKVILEFVIMDCSQRRPADDAA